MMEKKRQPLYKVVGRINDKVHRERKRGLRKIGSTYLSSLAAIETQKQRKKNFQGETRRHKNEKNAAISGGADCKVNASSGTRPPARSAWSY